MFNSLNLRNEKPALKAMAAGVLAAFSLCAQAGLEVAGTTRPTNVNDGFVDGTVYFAIFNNTTGTITASDPWGTGGYDLVNSALRGFNSITSDASPLLDTTAAYLYTYMTYNSSNYAPPSPITIASNGVQVDPSFVTSWGAFMLTEATTGGAKDEQSTIINFDPSCPVPANGDQGGMLFCGAGSTVTIMAHPGPGVINGETTLSAGHTQRFSLSESLVNGGIYASNIEQDASGILAQYGGILGTGGLLGDAGGADVRQFSSVFYFTSNTPYVPGVTSLQSTKGSADGTILLPGIVPEPGILGLLGAGLFFLGLSRRSRQA